MTRKYNYDDQLKLEKIKIKENDDPNSSFTLNEALNIKTTTSKISESARMEAQTEMLAALNQKIISRQSQRRQSLLLPPLDYENRIPTTITDFKGVANQEKRKI